MNRLKHWFSQKKKCKVLGIKKTAKNQSLSIEEVIKRYEELISN